MKFNEIYEGLLQGKKYRLSYWKKDEFIYYNKTYGTFRNKFDVKVTFTVKELMTLNNWEEYKEDIYDKYNKYIGCLCYFYDNTDIKPYVLGILDNIDIKHYKPFIRKLGNIKFAYTNCEPVKPEEIKFYKEKE